MESIRSVGIATNSTSVAVSGIIVKSNGELNTLALGVSSAASVCSYEAEVSKDLSFFLKFFIYFNCAESKKIK